MDPSSFETSHVHSIYNEIASDFSRTRHSRWPFVEAFLKSLPTGSLVLDAGTGNGKYLGVRSLLEWHGKQEDVERARKGKEPEEIATETLDSSLFNVGYDMSDGLLGIASGKGHEVVRGDCVDMSCWRRGAFDHAISIATIHHFATPERRIESIKQMIMSILPPSPPSSNSSSSSAARRTGRILIVVWSLEQDPSLLGARSARRTTGGKKGAIEIEMDPLLAQQRRDQGREEVGEDGEEEKAEKTKIGKDVFVPWERQEEVVPRKKKEPTPRRKGPKGAAHSGVAGVEERISKLTVDEKKEEESTSSPTSAESTSTAPMTESSESAPPALPKPTFNRYYHLFAHFELSSLVQSAAESLGLEFEYPPDYPLKQLKRQRGNIVAGWEAFVRLKEERWERENWVAEIEVGWRKQCINQE